MRAAIRVQQIKSEQVTIRVGSDSKQRGFAMPKDLLCARAEWFKNALKEDRFIEGSTGVIELPDDLPEVFEAFEFFLYQSQLWFESPDKLTEEELQEELILNARIWTFGDKYLLPQLQDIAMSRMCAVLDQGDALNCSAHTLAQCYNAVRADSPVRLIIIDNLVDRLQHGEDISMAEELAACPGIFAASMHLNKNFTSSQRTTFQDIASPGSSTSCEQDLRPMSLNVLLINISHTGTTWHMIVESAGTRRRSQAFNASTVRSSRCAILAAPATGSPSVGPAATELIVSRKRQGNSVGELIILA
ncbi:hypothetical protein CLAFUW4_05315 [Fulvia fulva]|uniref:BTB domain-containing protein n=1 Tax=Passalora fulva TaxID=5499 RepID=A0A9Q8LHF5_PASFU|nr:uncharacterized protein CLAFUR5_05462 [Fulvia fulva]KAK4623949.1 hypothetical protein CLAFUR4_05309 [Fulvia fulva]KAK4625467.1 hypothetical protein CLAFUR0_05316 [Fulvia fulva]UJO17691.1 hypothetical protein CLAFUR5_05462 [Fulvia fulva]WPV15441.1 hypothetical protein CLAFUW4_05315 [Fulvia fulva]WPV29785.1 hypothetical protein CLAFUW7_05314 [Fulvia fulva]